MKSKNEITAITPDEVFKKKEEGIIPEMIEAVNQLLIEKASGLSVGELTITLKQDDVVKRCLSICEANNITMTRETIFERKYLDFENIFRDNGWNVEYDKPAYNETYAATFKFSTNRQRIRKY